MRVFVRMRTFAALTRLRFLGCTFTQKAFSYHGKAKY